MSCDLCTAGKSRQPSGGRQKKQQQKGQGQSKHVRGGQVLARDARGAEIDLDSLSVMVLLVMVEMTGGDARVEVGRIPGYMMQMHVRQLSPNQRQEQHGSHDGQDKAQMSTEKMHDAIRPFTCVPCQGRVP